jgi:hypothetical protein
MGGSGGSTWAGGMAQVVECWPSKHKALSSNPSTGRKKKWGRGGRQNVVS